MFMFVFAIILISLVGLFLQITNALTMYIASQQMGMGQQLILWQNLAMQYACTSGLVPGVPVVGDVATGPNLKSDPLAQAIHTIRPEYQGRNWGAAIFTGNMGPTIGTRLVLTYIPNSSVFAGMSSSEVVRQFRSSFKNNEYRFSAVYDGPAGRSMDVVVSATGHDAYPVTVTGIPNGVPAGVSGIVSGVSCN
jgi:hypothetical protein